MGSCKTCIHSVNLTEDMKSDSCKKCFNDHISQYKRGKGKIQEVKLNAPGKE